MDISMKQFMTNVTNSNTSFKLSKSSLKSLIDNLGGTFDESKGLDMRNITSRETLSAIHTNIWGTGLSEQGSMPIDKRRKYKTALDYLVGAMWDNPASQRIVLKKRENKNSWSAAFLNQAKWFIHCSGVTPQQILASGGLDPRKSSEVCIPLNGLLGDWEWHEFIFAFEQDKPNELKPPKAAATAGFSAGGYIYRFQATRGTEYMSQHGNIVHGRETGFPNLIPVANIEAYSWQSQIATRIQMAGFKE